MKNNRALDVGLLIVRAGVGILMLFHGFPKLLNFTGMAPDFMDPFRVGGHTTLVLVLIAEVLCSVFLIFGLFTRWATIPLIILMLFLLFKVHVGDGFSRLELPLHYLMGYVVLFLLGGGKFSVDYLKSKK